VLATFCPQHPDGVQARSWRTSWPDHQRRTVRPSAGTCAARWQPWKSVTYRS